MTDDPMRALREATDAAAAALADARQFKIYVHDRLDMAGVPADPEPEHTGATGCRIQGRLNWLINKANLASRVANEVAKDLNIDHNEARALHRVVRAIHDGECPRCHVLISSERMRVTERRYVNGVIGDIFVAWKCPYCHFKITDAEAKLVIPLFGEYMEKNLAIFERWRDQQTIKTGS